MSTSKGFSEGSFYICKRDIKQIIFDNMNKLPSNEIAIILNKENFRTKLGQLWTTDNINKFIVEEKMIWKI